MLDDSSNKATISRTHIPWLLRSPRIPGIAITVVLGIAGMYMSWRNYGLSSLHGLWIAAVIAFVYYLLQDCFRLRAAVEDIRITGKRQELLHYSSGVSPHEKDFYFPPDKDTRASITKEACSVSLSSGVVKVVRPKASERFFATIRHYMDGSCIPIRNVLTRRFRVMFEYCTSGPPFHVSVRLRRSPMGSWEKRRDGEYCVEQLTLRETEWAKCPSVLLEPAHPDREFLISLEFDNGPNELGPEHHLLLQNIQIIEDL